MVNLTRPALETNFHKTTTQNLSIQMDAVFSAIYPQFVPKWLQITILLVSKLSKRWAGLGENL